MPRLVPPCVLLAPAILASHSAYADDVVIVDAEAHCVDTRCQFSVTLRHADQGWDHYADQWRIVDADGNELGVRTLLHPHVEEQPFTRSLGDVTVPAHLDRVTVVARDSVHGESDQTYTILLKHR